MLLANLDQPETYALLRRHSIWMEILDWLKAMPFDIAKGIYSLRDDESIFVNVHGYETLPREQCRYEAHQRFVDLQYMIEGEELIEWRPLFELESSSGYRRDKDVTHYTTPAGTGTVLCLRPRCFAVFYPEDGHMPKMQAGKPSPLKKLVVKVDRAHL